MPIVMGTAGHIDHGKTSLVKALTGMDCDRLEEEKRRGITIALGFAALRLPGAGDKPDRVISVIDVPGHERFVHTMVAGTSGIDFVLMVIAADEGVMPQTREHLEICGLLGITRGLVALTKADAVDSDLLALAHDDIAAFTQGTFLAGAPVIPVSAVTGQGLETLGEALANEAGACAPSRSRDIFRIPVDRVFSLRGQGTVLTGTMLGGTLKPGDIVQAYPGTLVSKVRSVQNHWGPVEEAVPGRRTAVNVPDLAPDEIRRGDTLSRPGMLFPSRRWLVQVICQPSSPRALRNRAELHLYHGSREIQARLCFFDRDVLRPGETCLCELRLPEDAVAVFGDRFVLRAFSPLRTVGGGVVLNPLGMPVRKREQWFAERCATMQSLASQALSPAVPGPAAMERLVVAQLACTTDAAKGLSFAALRVLTNCDVRALEKALAGLMAKKQVFCFDKANMMYVGEGVSAPLAAACEAVLAAYHKASPEKQGMNRNELLTRWGRGLPPKLVHCITEQLTRNGTIEVQGEYVRLAQHEASFSHSQAPLVQGLLWAYQEAGWAPPALSAVCDNLKIKAKQAMPLLTLLCREGRLVRVSAEFWYAAEHLEAVKGAVAAWFVARETLDIADMKALTSLSRRHMIPLLEFFDARKITVRRGDVRVRGRNGS